MISDNLRIIHDGARFAERYGYLPESHDAYTLIADTLLGMFNVRLREGVSIRGIDLGSIRSIDEFLGEKSDPFEIQVRTYDTKAHQNDISYTIPSSVLRSSTIEEGMRLARAERQIEYLTVSIARETREFEIRMADLNRSLNIAQKVVESCKRSAAK